MEIPATLGLELPRFIAAVHPEHEGSGSGGIADVFGFDLPKFLAQIIIVMIVYWILKKYAFGPITSMLAARSRKIAEIEEQSKQIKLSLAGAEAKAAELLRESNARADKMMAEAKESAEKLAMVKSQEAINEAQSIIAKAKEAGVAEVTKMRSDLKREFGRVLVQATQQATGKVLNEDDQHRLNHEVAQQVAL